jgi:hypothetical protein
VYHDESPVIDILRAAAPPPAARVITFTDGRSADVTIGCVANAIDGLVSSAGEQVHIDRRALDPWSARVLAGRLAAVCDRIAA